MKLRKHQTLREQIVTSLRETIINGEVMPGQKLTEPELAEKLGISRTPIREAFRQLESEGFLTVMPRRGAVVSRITRKEIDDFYELKSLLEGYAARIAAGKIDEKGIQKLKKINNQLSELAEKNDIEAYFMKNDEFHNVFVSYCGNEKLLELLEHMLQRFMRFRLGALSVPGRLKKSIQQHDEIIGALAKNDGLLAETLVLEHALLSGEQLADQVARDMAQ